MSTLARLFLLGVLLVSGLVDLPRLINFGPFSGLALLTIIYTVFPLALWIGHPTLYRDALAKLWPMMLLVSLGLLPLAWQAPSIPFIQNILIYTSFILLTLLAYNCGFSSPSFPRQTLSALKAAGILAVVMYGIGTLKNGIDAETLMGPRPFALFALVALAYYLSAWRYQLKHGGILALATVGMIGISLSRLALVVGILLFPLSRLSHRDRWTWVKIGLNTTLAIGAIMLMVQLSEPLHSRFLKGDTSIQVGGVAINSSGRSAIWEVVWGSYLEAPVLGKGVGTVDDLVGSHFSKDTVGHPHNDYLRILHDFGGMGFLLWLLGFYMYLRFIGEAWRFADLNDLPTAPLHMTAFLALIALALGMTTDNPLIYLFVMAPIGILVGCSLGVAARESKEALT